jgi:hypothetical protein
VVEVADTPARGAGGASYAGSIPAVGTNVLFPFLAELADALGSELSVFGHPGSTPGERTSVVSQRVIVRAGV